MAREGKLIKRVLNYHEMPPEEAATLKLSIAAASGPFANWTGLSDEDKAALNKEANGRLREESELAETRVRRYPDNFYYD